MNLSARIQDIVSRLEETRGLYYNLARPAAELLFVLARLARPRRIVEVGTANGYSALVLGAAVQSHRGEVVTIERFGRLVDVARANIAAAGLQDVVTVVPGSAYKVLKRIPGPIDLLFLDGTKQEYLGYLERARPKFGSSALVVADNVLSHRDDLLQFIQAIVSDPSASSAVVPVGTGLLIASYERATSTRAESALSPIGAVLTQAMQRLPAGSDEDATSGDEETEDYVETLAEEAEHLPIEQGS